MSCFSSIELVFFSCSGKKGVLFLIHSAGILFLFWEKVVSHLFVLYYLLHHPNIRLLCSADMCSFAWVLEYLRCSFSIWAD